MTIPATFARAAARALLPARLRRVFHQGLRCGFYRFGFGGESQLARRWGAVVAELEGQQRPGDAPRPQSVWESEYARAQWSYLNGPQERRRYRAIGAAIQRLKPRAALLDIGCGEGVLVAHLGADYQCYVGVDLAHAAVASAGRSQNHRCSFVQADAQSFFPDQYFDVIVFNEVLYYFDDPLATLERSTNWLAPGGLVITSLYDRSVRARAIKRQIARRYRLIRAAQLGTGGASWSLLIFTVLPSDRRSPADLGASGVSA